MLASHVDRSKYPVDLDNQKVQCTTVGLEPEKYGQKNRLHWYRCTPVNEVENGDSSRHTNVGETLDGEADLCERSDKANIHNTDLHQLQKETTPKNTKSNPRLNTQPNPGSGDLRQRPAVHPQHYTGEVGTNQDPHQRIHRSNHGELHRIRRTHQTKKSRRSSSSSRSRRPAKKKTNLREATNYPIRKHRADNPSSRATDPRVPTNAAPKHPRVAPRKNESTLRRGRATSKRVGAAPQNHEATPSQEEEAAAATL